MSSPQTGAGPRLFGIPASRAPVVAVIRRGPSAWCHVGRWDLERGHYEPGAWLRGTLYPQKCDLSPDGRWLAYSALKPGADWPAGEIFEAVSRLPWLTALAAWNAGTTYTRGIHFTETPGASSLGHPDVGDVAPLLRRYGLDLARPVQFPVERRRGWVESADTPPRPEGGPWDESRRVALEKPQPAAERPWTLRVEGDYGAFRTLRDGREPVEYALLRDAELQMLDDVQWADWDAAGNLLLATRSGRLQVRRLEGEQPRTTWEEDLAPLRPDPQPAPAWAAAW